MTLREQVEEFKTSRNRPPEGEAIPGRGVDRIRPEGRAGGLSVGERAPDYSVRMDPAEILGALRGIAAAR